MTHNDVITKTMAKFGPPRNQTNYISFNRVIENVLFIEFGPLCQKVWTFMSNFGLFYHASSLNMVMSRDPSFRFGKFLTLL